MEEKIHIHRNWYGKKIKWVMNDICKTGLNVQYSDSSGNAWIKEERLYQCPKCKKVVAIY